MANRMLDAFTHAYLKAALWTSDPDPCSGEWSEHDDWTIDNIAPDSIAQAIADCAAFQKTYAHLLTDAGSDSQNGHDFFLTRCRHGAGFWDRGYPKAIGAALTDAAHTYGDVYIYGPETDDDGSVSETAFEAWDRVIHIG